MRAAGLSLLFVSFAIGCGGSDTKGDTRPAKPEGDSGTVKAWQRNWCRVKPRMTRKQVYAIMGQPTGVFKVNAAGYDVKSQAEWTAAGGVGPGPTYAAFFTAEDTANQLQAHNVKISCASMRSQP